MQRISTASYIAAPPEVVWDVLRDFRRYDEWNPFMSVVGRPNAGARLVVELRPPGRRTVRFRPRVTAVVPERELRWRGSLGLPGLYDGEHQFRLEPADGGTEFRHEETFSGALVAPINRWTRGATERGFEAMNAALKARAEAIAAGDEPAVRVYPAADPAPEPLGQDPATP